MIPLGPGEELAVSQHAPSIAISSDASHIAYVALFWQPADGSGPAERLTQSDFTQYPASWSPDGKTLAFYETRPDTGRDIWLLTLDEPQPSLQL